MTMTAYQQQAEFSTSQGMQGVLFLVVGNVILALVLILVQKMFSSAPERLVVLMLINAVLGATGLATARRQCLGVFRRNRLAIVIWVFAYCAAYGAFLIWPAQLPLGLFIIASALSPSLAALAFGLLKARNSERISFASMTPMLLLMVLAGLEGQFASGAYIVALFLFVLVSHTAIQYGLRSTAHEDRPAIVSFVVSLLNAGLLIAILAAKRPAALLASPKAILTATVIAPAVLFLQYLHLSGLRRTTLTMGALGMSTAVPISIVVEEAISRIVHIASLGVALCFVAAVLYKEVRAGKIGNRLADRHGY
jgi:hypothetical protein